MQATLWWRITCQRFYSRSRRIQLTWISCFLTQKRANPGSKFHPPTESRNHRTQNFLVIEVNNYCISRSICVYILCILRCKHNYNRDAALNFFCNKTQKVKSPRPINFLTQFCCQAICTQRTPKGPMQVIVGSMNIGNISDTARNRTHNLFHPY